MQQLSRLGTELRDLAAELRRAAQASPAMALAAPIVANCADHLLALARNVDSNVLFRREKSAGTGAELDLPREPIRGQCD